jgi:hypothetical protein
MAQIVPHSGFGPGFGYSRDLLGIPPEPRTGVVLARPDRGFDPMPKKRPTRMLGSINHAL